MQQNIIEHLKAVKEWAEQQPQREGAPPWVVNDCKSLVEILDRAIVGREHTFIGARTVTAKEGSQLSVQPLGHSDRPMA